MTDAEAAGQNPTRRDFLKTSVLSSVAAAVGVPAVSEDSQPEAQRERGSVIAVTGVPVSAPLRMPWKNAIAVDVPLLLQREDLQNHLGMLQRAIGYRYCRIYGFLQDEMAMVARRADGSLAFQWAQADKVLDALQRLRLRPFMNLSPMPVALASGTTTVFDWRMNTTPPRDYAEWGQFVAAFARHCVDRYGLDEIAQWYFEVWNEPNGSDFWPGSMEDYFRLYDASAVALKSVSPRLRVGGPVTAHAAWIPEFLSHCSAKGMPVDFISTHIYAQDEFAEYPGLRDSPHKPGMYVADVVRSVRDAVRKSAFPNLEIHWTEWNSLMPLSDGAIAWDNNPTLDNASAAAMVCDLALAVDGDCKTFCWWTASDLVGQSGIPRSEFSGTYGLLTLNGIHKATLNAFRFLSRLRGRQLEVRHEPLPAGCNLVATAEGDVVRVLLWYRDLSAYGRVEQHPWAATVQIPWTESARPVLIQERIVAGAGSCYETWQALGRPPNLSPVEHELLQGQSAPEGRVFNPDAVNGQVSQDVRLVPGEVVYLELSPQVDAVD